MSCGLIIAPQTKNYDLSKIYNAQYFINMDTGWEKRSKQALKFINMLDVIFKLKKMRICDYGAGNGYLTKSLIEAKYNILAYEPYLNNGTYLDKRYYRTKPFAADVILMIEVFEHFTDAKNQIKEILSSFNYPKIIIFTTLLTDNNKNIAEGSSEGYRLISFFSFHIFIKKYYKKEYALIKLPSILITVFYNFLKKNIL
jgi:2-polyprenyl-3-methyl-5-hydroxy-6-metoxy-1,4-benzoquinol methylase